jgi:hypothetical protein
MDTLFPQNFEKYSITFQDNGHAFSQHFKTYSTKFQDSGHTFCNIRLIRVLDSEIIDALFTTL